MVSQEDFFAEEVGDENARPSTDPHTALIVDRTKEIIWSFENARDRSQQRVPGPSELGSDCQRKLAYTTMGSTPVNHSYGDHWAASVGTAIHAQLAEAYELANNNSGRYKIEHRVYMTTESGIVVKGSLDVYDRKLRTVIDHKCPSTATRKRYLRQGPSRGYIEQLHVYGYGLEQQGEEPERVALLYYPREGKTSEIAGWSTKYDRNTALATLARYDALAAKVASFNGDKARLGEIPKSPSPLCGWCAHYMPNSPNPALGCQGKMGPN